MPRIGFLGLVNPNTNRMINGSALRILASPEVTAVACSFTKTSSFFNSGFMIVSIFKTEGAPYVVQIAAFIVYQFLTKLWRGGSLNVRNEIQNVQIYKCEQINLLKLILCIA